MNNLNTFIRTFIEWTKKDLSICTKRGLLGCIVRRISALYENHLHTRWYLTNQTNINFPLFSGFSVWVWMNLLIARRIRSDSLIWYVSQMVDISSLRTFGILRQVWYGCFFISISFRHFEFWKSFDLLFLEYVPLLIYWLEVFSSDPINVWSLNPVGHCSLGILLFSLLYRSI